MPRKDRLLHTLDPWPRRPYIAERDRLVLHRRASAMSAMSWLAALKSTRLGQQQCTAGPALPAGRDVDVEQARVFLVLHGRHGRRRSWRAARMVASTPFARADPLRSAAHLRHRPPRRRSPGVMHAPDLLAICSASACSSSRRAPRPAARHSTKSPVAGRVLKTFARRCSTVFPAAPAVTEAGLPAKPPRPNASVRFLAGSIRVIEGRGYDDAGVSASTPSASSVQLRDVRCTRQRGILDAQGYVGDFGFAGDRHDTAGRFRSAQQGCTCRDRQGR